MSEGPGSGSQEDGNGTAHGYIDVGDYGVVAYETAKQCDAVQVWGTPAAVKKVHNAFGTTWPCT